MVVYNDTRQIHTNQSKFVFVQTDVYTHAHVSALIVSIYARVTYLCSTIFIVFTIDNIRIDVRPKRKKNDNNRYVYL